MIGTVSVHILFVYLIKDRRINTLCTNVISIITCRVEFIVTFRHLSESVYCFGSHLHLLCFKYNNMDYKIMEPTPIVL